VPEVGIILLLRKFGSRVIRQQVIGTRPGGSVRVKGVDPTEPQICAGGGSSEAGAPVAVWDIFNAKKRQKRPVLTRTVRRDGGPAAAASQAGIEYTGPRRLIFRRWTHRWTDAWRVRTVGDRAAAAEAGEGWKEALDGIELRSDGCRSKITKVRHARVRYMWADRAGKTIHSAPEASGAAMWSRGHPMKRCARP